MSSLTRISQASHEASLIARIALGAQIIEALVVFVNAGVVAGSTEGRTEHISFVPAFAASACDG
jgi:hypothetical protein